MAFVRNHSNTSGPVGALGMYMQSLSIVLSVTIFVAVLPSAYAGVLFAWHPICMSIGYLGLMCEGISTACSARETDGVVRVQALSSHMWLQVSSTILTSLGFAAIYVNKAIHGKSHFRSLHGKLGSITYCLSLFLIVLGVCSFKRLKLIDRFPMVPSFVWSDDVVSVAAGDGDYSSASCGAARHCGPCVEIGRDVLGCIDASCAWATGHERFTAGC